MHEAATGVWATMVTPFTDDGAIDYPGLTSLVDWYIDNRVAGLFAVCRSSESFEMTLEERVSVAEYVVRAAAGRAQVIAGGNLCAGVDAQVDEAVAIAATGVDGVVLLTSTVADQVEGDAAWRRRMEELVARIPGDVALGIYESPSPYHRTVTPESLAWCLATGRFRFLKDTSCDAEAIKAKLRILDGSSFRLFNANTQTLLASLRGGAAGYSSVMANVSPRLYHWLIGNHRSDPDRAERLGAFLSVADAALVARCYPASAKYYLTLEGLPISTHTREKTRLPLDSIARTTMEHLRRVVKEYEGSYGA